jgi:hypothetical protein
MWSVRGRIDWVCYLWKTALLVTLDSSPGSMYDWKGVQEKAGEVDSTNVYVTSDEISPLISQRVSH